MALPNIEKWMDGKKLLTAIFALEFASSPKYLFEYAASLRNGTINKHIPITIPIRQWLSFYRSHKQIQAVIADRLVERQFGEFTNSELFQLLQWYSQTVPQLNEDKKAQLSRIITKQIKRQNSEDINRILSESQNRAKAMLDDTLNDISGKQEETLKIDKKSFGLPEFAFFLRVLMPCWIYYRKLPTVLYRNARQGDYYSIKDLLVFDKTILQDPKIFSHIHGQWDKGRKSLMKAIPSEPKKLSKKTLKIRAAGFIQLFTSGFDRLNAPDMQSLFDAIEKDRSNGKSLIDKDLPGNPESLAKDLQRERTRWPKNNF